jgi:ribonuclease G
MAEQIIVNVTSFETRLAVVEDGHLLEVLVERHKDRGIVGNVYLGRVQRVLPGMQAAFVEIGLDKAAFLYVGDVVPPDDDVDESALNESGEGASVVEEDDAAREKAPVRSNKKKARRPERIEDVLKQGQSVLVQIAKDAIGTKGPRVTCNISLPGRYLVYMPTHTHVGVSRRITDDAERQRLKVILEAARPDEGGYVVRTVSEGLDAEKIKTDATFLHTMWTDVKNRSQGISGPALIQRELDLVLRTARDLLTDNVTRMVVDDRETWAQLRHFMGLRDPHLVERIELYESTEPIFDHFEIEPEIGRAMNRKVWLKSGGYLVIDQAEALTAIDVNTGRFVGKRNLEETILKTNLEAVDEVATQLRLRNIGGMVIIDFIDMEAEIHREQISAALVEALKGDRARCNVVRMSELGLVEMTRQRTRESLTRMLTEPCWYCEGRGTLKSKRSIAFEIFRQLEHLAGRLSEPVVVVQAHPEVADLMLDEETDVLLAIEGRIQKPVVVRPRGSFHQEQFDIFGASEQNLEGALRTARSKVA